MNTNYKEDLVALLLILALATLVTSIAMDGPPSSHRIVSTRIRSPQCGDLDSA